MLTGDSAGDERVLGFMIAAYDGMNAAPVG
jgi:hypothetical protein